MGHLKISATAFLLLTVATFLWSAQSPVTLAEALKESRAANARLPVPQLDIAISQERLEEVKASRWLRLALSGDFIYSPANSYDPNVSNLGESRMQVVATQPVLTGGAVRATVAQAQAQIEGARARFRMAEKDLELEVRNRFAEVLEANAEIAARQAAILRLETYATSLESRRAAGQAVAADLLATRVRVSQARIDLEDAQARLVQSKEELNDLMGRDPLAQLELAPLSPPEPAPETGTEPWMAAPEISEASAQFKSLTAGVSLLKSERRPHLDFEADAGFWGGDTAHLGTSLSRRYNHDRGYELGLNFTWPFWNAGSYRARLAEGNLAVQQAARQETAVLRQARLNWSVAHEARTSAYEEFEILRQAVPQARDSYLEAEARYRGGAGTALEVLDAYTQSVTSAVALAQSALRYEIATALELRWGTP